MTPNPDAPMQQPSWFSRNWKWLIPVGCVVPFLCCLSFVGVTYFGVTTLIKGSAPYTQAITRAEANAEVQAELGTPLTPGTLATGSLKNENGNGTADFNVDIAGPKGKGSIHVVGTARSGAWNLSVIDVQSDSGKVIHVAGDDVGDAPPEPEDTE